MYSIINIVGLAISFSVAICILLWVKNELNYDKFHQQEKNIYQSVATFNMEGKDMYWKTSSPPLAIHCQEEIPEIKKTCRVHQTSWSIAYNENKVGELKSYMVDSTFFSIFNFPLLEGDVSKPLPDGRSVVLSRHMASVLFGNENAVGKIIRVDGNKEFHVTAIMEDMPIHTTFYADVIYSYELMKEYKSEGEMNSWSSLGVLTFFLLAPDVNSDVVAQQITKIQQKNFPNFKITYLLQPLAKNHFYEADGHENSNMQACRLFTISVFILLIIACINYVNLITARFAKRNKELFVKKILGAKKSKLFMQSMTESIVLFITALILATLLLYLIFPVFRTISGKEIEFHLFSIETLSVYLLTFIVVTILAGIFPAISLSVGNPLQIIKKNNGGKHGFLFFRRSLVVLQFISAIILILGSITINKQMQFIQKKDLGYNRENILSIGLSHNSSSQYKSIKSDLLQQSGILGITSSTEDILHVNSASSWGKDLHEMVMMNFTSVDKDFISTMNMTLKEGSDFTGTPSDSLNFIVNETAVEKAGISNPIGSNFTFAQREGTIIGVIKDFNFKNLHEKMTPLVLYIAGDPRIMYVRIAPQSASQAISAIESTWKRYLPGTPFEYHFLDDEFDKLYKSDLRINQLFNVFAIIAILISCLGLFGLVTYTAETKTKEIGIRKVLGASVSNIVNMLSKEFLILVCFSMIIAFPLAYYWLNKMLQEYAYRTNIEWWMFILAGLITIGLTIITVGWQAVKAATANPVKSIKVE